MQYLSEEIIEKCVNMRDAAEAVKLAYAMAEKGQIVTPLRTVIPAQKGSLLFMPAYSEQLGFAVLKNVNVFPENAGSGLATTPAEILLIDAKNGYVLTMLDGTYVTQLRTGAASCAAFDLLAKKCCKKGALIGTGGQAQAQLDAMLTARELKEVSIFSRNYEKCAAFTEKMSAKFAESGVNFVCAKSAAECVEDADLIITATTASKPVFDGSLVKKGATVSCIGTYEPHKHEIDPELIARADKIYCDSKEAVLSESGDILIPISCGIITENDIFGGLGEVVNGTLPGRENDDEIIVFESVGIAAQDLTASVMIYRKALVSE